MADTALPISHTYFPTKNNIARAKFSTNVVKILHIVIEMHAHKKEE